MDSNIVIGGFTVQPILMRHSLQYFVTNKITQIVFWIPVKSSISRGSADSTKLLHKYFPFSQWNFEADQKFFLRIVDINQNVLMHHQNNCISAIDVA